jgi:hypothetical protein
MISSGYLNSHASITYIMTIPLTIIQAFGLTLCLI